MQEASGVAGSVQIFRSKDHVLVKVAQGSG